MSLQSPVFSAIQQEFYDWRLWAGRGVVLAFGYTPTRNMLEGNGDSSHFYVLLKFVATWLTTWAGVPAGIFVPSLAIGGRHAGPGTTAITAYAGPTGIKKEPRRALNSFVNPVAETGPTP